MAATPSGVVDASSRADDIDKDMGVTWASKNREVFRVGGVWVFEFEKDTMGVFGSSNITCLEVDSLMKEKNGGKGREWAYVDGSSQEIILLVDLMVNRNAHVVSLSSDDSLGLRSRLTPNSDEDSGCDHSRSPLVRKLGSTKVVFAQLVNGGIEIVRGKDFLRVAKEGGRFHLGSFIEKKPHFHIVQFFAMKMWQKYGFKEVMSNDKGFSFFKIEDEVARKLIEVVKVCMPIEDIDKRKLMIVRVDYHGKPSQCGMCKVFDHKDEVCSQQLRLME
ncbi:hypothetical protein Patl1_23588 [Pistacia atlantica]|uniref:Uncharacterized protein n=1 Tax=Pistacia atlantica TaxID=434234 RepID=A0ACC0ZWA0_9ROSI|nr:hypothetical protein Patl1_23588 [Pistacia atlantica]